ncbi:MAG: DUF2851 family protein [Spirosomataceae bacterium]
MSEDFLYFLWQFQYFDSTDLQTTTGESLQIVTVGQRNTDAGPDFFNGHVWIDSLEWIGTIEMHLRSSDWHRHLHTHNHAYDSVVLHVVWENDEHIQRPDGTHLPTLELKTRTSKELLFKYHTLLENKEIIPCASHFNAVADIQKRAMLDRALMQRLQQKAEAVKMLLERNHHDWEETAYQVLAQNFGFKINAEPMLRSTGLPLKILQKHCDNLIQIEAMLLGQASFVDGIEKTDEYTATLKREYDFLASKYSLYPLQLRPREWRFLRLRPANFPTVRLAQLAALIQKQQGLFSLFIRAESLMALVKKLRVPQSPYWQKHYQFQKEAIGKVPMLGKASAENIITNSVVPLLVAYSEVKNNQDFLDRAVALLEQLPAEKNHITDQWKALGLEAKTAFDTQATIELYNSFCHKKRCLNCSIGTTILKSK